MEALKMRYNRGRRSNLLFYRDSNGNEVDLVCSFADRLVGVEIKAGATMTGDYFTGLERLSAALPQPLAGKMLEGRRRPSAARAAKIDSTVTLCTD
jgi:hypothetical protein